MPFPSSTSRTLRPQSQCQLAIPSQRQLLPAPLPPCRHTEQSSAAAPFLNRFVPWFGMIALKGSSHHMRSENPLSVLCVLLTSPRLVRTVAHNGRAGSQDEKFDTLAAWLTLVR